MVEKSETEAEEAMPKVRALKETVKRLKHPRYDIVFDENGEAEWPLDQFTRRRIRDRDVELVVEDQTDD